MLGAVVMAIIAVIVGVAAMEHWTAGIECREPVRYREIIKEDVAEIGALGTFAVQLVHDVGIERPSPGAMRQS